MYHLIAMMGSPENGGGNPFGMLIPMIAIFVIFYFMIIRPQQKRAKEQKKMLEALQKGDKIVLSSGIHGSIAGLEDKTVLVDVGNNVKIKFERSAISSVIKD